MAPHPPADLRILHLLEPDVLPRSRWADGLEPVGPLVEEKDVRLLVIHHTGSRNDYTRLDTAKEIQGFHRFHVGPQRGWPDVAYNFLVDRFGRIWEGRAGSLERAVRADATGGSQGYAQLCALIGDHHSEPVSEEAMEALVRLVAWLGARHGIDTSPGSEVTLVSRGSDRWAVGTEVTAATIVGHRDMSLTSCPGDVAYAVVTEQLPEAATTRRREVAGRMEAAPAANGPTRSRREAKDDAHRAASTAVGNGRPAVDEGFSEDGPRLVGLGLSGSAALAMLGGLLALRRRRSV